MIQNQRKKQFEIAIIGAGFIGLTAALLLAKNNPNLKVALIEKNDFVNKDRPRDGRAFAVSQSSLKIFRKIGIFDKIKEQAGTIEDIKIIDGRSPFFLDFASKDDGFFGFLIENYLLHKIFKEEILHQGNIEILAPNSYQEINFEKNCAKIFLDNGQEVETKIILGCDGRQSNLRKIFNFEIWQKSYGQNALVFNISHEKKHKNIALEQFFSDGPFAVLPFSRQNESSIVLTLEKKKAAAVKELNEAEFGEYFSGVIGDYLGEVKVTSDVKSYPLDLVLAKKFYHQRLILVGDAAHGIHPIAGQGFNLGVGDISFLDELISEQNECGLDIGSEILVQKYNRKRKVASYKMIAATDGLNCLFSNKSLSLKLLRSAGLGMVEKAPFLKNFFIKNAGGV